MKPFGLFYSREGCTCSLCRQRGYRKGNAYDSAVRACKHRARQSVQREIKKELENM